MNEKLDHTLTLLPWLIVIILGVALAFELYGVDRYKVVFGTYLVPIAGGSIPQQGAIRIDGKTGRTWTLAPEPFDQSPKMGDARWVEVFDPQLTPQR